MTKPDRWYPENDNWTGEWLLISGVGLVVIYLYYARDEPLCCWIVPAVLVALWCSQNRALLTMSEEERKQARLAWEYWRAKEERDEENRRLRRERERAEQQELAEEHARRERQRIERARQTIEGLRTLSPVEFEEVIAELFRMQAWEATVTKTSMDGGVDIWLKKDTDRAAVQCKRFKRPVGVRIVREFYGVMRRFRITRGYIVTTATFTQDAQKFARGTKLRLIDQEELADWVAAWGVDGDYHDG